MNQDLTNQEIDEILARYEKSEAAEYGATYNAIRALRTIKHMRASLAMGGSEFDRGYNTAMHNNLAILDEAKTENGNLTEKLSFAQSSLEVITLQNNSLQFQLDTAKSRISFLYDQTGFTPEECAVHQQILEDKLEVYKKFVFADIERLRTIAGLETQIHKLEAKIHKLEHELDELHKERYQR